MPRSRAVLWRDIQGEVNAGTRKDRILLRRSGTEGYQNTEEEASGPLTHDASSYLSLSGPISPFVRGEDQRR